MLPSLVKELRESAGKCAKNIITIKYTTLQLLAEASIATFKTEPMLLKLSAPIKVCGDVHGQFEDLLRLFQMSGEPSEGMKYVFLGDYVDRGSKSIETICLLLAYKCLYPNTFWLLRGNHESWKTNRVYGFRKECDLRATRGIWKLFNEVFTYMPVAAVIGKSIFCCHGGLSPHLKTLNDIASLSSPIELDKSPIVTDLLWSDPNMLVEKYTGNSRGIGHFFGEKQLMDFLNANGLSFMIRAHVAISEGVEFHVTKDSLDFVPLITVFSAPDYKTRSHNKAGVVKILATRPQLKMAYECLFYTGPDHREVSIFKTEPFWINPLKKGSRNEKFVMLRKSAESSVSIKFHPGNPLDCQHYSLGNRDAYILNPALLPPPDKDIDILLPNHKDKKVKKENKI